MVLKEVGRILRSELLCFYLSAQMGHNGRPVALFCCLLLLTSCSPSRLVSVSLRLVSMLLVQLLSGLSVVFVPLQRSLIYEQRIFPFATSRQIDSRAAPRHAPFWLPSRQTGGHPIGLLLARSCSSSQKPPLAPSTHKKGALLVGLALYKTSLRLSMQSVCRSVSKPAKRAEPPNVKWCAC